jgi:hypothetical protein
VRIIPRKIIPRKAENGDEQFEEGRAYVGFWRSELLTN